MTPVTTLLFDLDDTLTDRTASLNIFTERFMNDFSSDLDDSMLFERVHEIIVAGDGGGYRPKEEMFREILAGLRWQTPPTLEMIASYWYDGSPYCMQPRWGVVSTLETLKARGYQLGIVTNGQTRVQNATLDVLHIRPLMSAIVISEEASVRKPDPRIFQLALSQLNALPEQTLYIGDHPVNDIGGAHAAGLRTVWLSGIHAWPADLPSAEFEISEIAQILDLLG